MKILVHGVPDDVLTFAPKVSPSYETLSSVHIMDGGCTVWYLTFDEATAAVEDVSCNGVG